MEIRKTFTPIEKDLQEVDRYLQNFLQKDRESLRRGFLHLLKAGGKRIRPAYTLLAAKFGKEDPGRIIPIAAAFELVHMASLIHDDVIDRSDLRRGEPTIWALYGNNFSLHFGDYLLAKALCIVEEYKNPRINSLLAWASVAMCQGEIQQIATAYDLDLSLRQYFNRIKRKTSILITLSCQGGALAASAEPETVRALGRYGHYVGMAFQITDDILDYIADEKTLGKPVGSDLQQGLLTLPAIYVLKYGSPEIRADLRRYLSEPVTQDDTCQAIELIKTTGAIEYCLEITNKYVEKALAELTGFPDIEATQSLRNLAHYVYNRQS